MPPKPLFQSDSGPEVLALQQALNRQAKQRFHPPVARGQPARAADVLRLPGDRLGARLRRRRAQGARHRHPRAAADREPGRAQAGDPPARPQPRADAARADDRVRRRPDVLGPREAAAARARERLGRPALELRPPRGRRGALQQEVAGRAPPLLPARERPRSLPARVRRRLQPGERARLVEPRAALGRQRLPRPGRAHAPVVGARPRRDRPRPAAVHPRLARVRDPPHLPDQPEGVPPPQLHGRSRPRAAAGGACGEACARGGLGRRADTGARDGCRPSSRSPAPTSASTSPTSTGRRCARPGTRSRSPRSPTASARPTPRSTRAAGRR